MPQLTIQQAFDLALQHHQSGRLQQAEQLYRQILAQQPNHSGALHLLGVIAHQVGRIDMAVDLIRKAIALNPRFSEAQNNLGNALRDQGHLNEAIAAYHQALVNSPNFAEAHINLGIALRETGLLNEAIAAMRQGIALNPNMPEAHNNLGVALCNERLFDEAVAAYRRALALKPNYAEACNNLATVLKDIGQFDESIAAYRQTLVLNPRNTDAHSNLLLALHYLPGVDVQTIAEEHRRWNQLHAEPLKVFVRHFPNERNPDRRLRIGYVSPDFRDHAVAPMVLPLLASHDHAQFEVLCYAQVPKPDAITERFRAQADQWRSTMHLSDEQVAALIRNDQIDILVDLAGHTSGNRLLVFARQPAPVQVTRQGYPNTTGLSTIAYRMTDAYADPPGLSDTLHSEQLIRLPQTNWIYQPPEHSPAPQLRPAGAALTFGCFNNFAKVTAPMLILWSRILHALPASRLLIKAQALGSETTRQRVRQLFTDQGIDLARLELRGHEPGHESHLALYGQMDIALDPFPYHGTTTTCEALWMGVPVITLAGQTHVSRVGVSLLSNVGLPELVAETPDAYLKIAVELAHDIPRLTHLRATLRQRLQQSPLMDAPRFARHIESAYRQIWRTWCAT